MKLFKIIIIGVFLLISNNVIAQQAIETERENNLVEQKDTTVLSGLYKTKINSTYWKMYKTKEYSTVEFKENGKAEIQVVTDNTESSLPKSKDCYIFRTIDQLEYKIVDGNKIEFSCVRQLERGCNNKDKNGCFDYILEGKITDKGIVINHSLFVKE